eukprot:92721_1
MSSYTQFQSESEGDSDDSQKVNTVDDNTNEYGPKFQIGTYCYCDNNAFAVITDISFDECIILNLFRKKQQTMEISSLKIMTKSIDIQKAKKMYQKYKNTNNNTMEMISHKISKPQKPKPQQQSNAGQQMRSNCEKRFCGPKCAMHAIYGICFVLFLILIAFAICFLLYGLPLVNNGNKLKNSLIESKCFIMNYDIINCMYDCYKCDDIARCNKCKGPFCSKCDAAAYKYYATSKSVCDDIKLESQLSYGECPQQANELLSVGVEYNCYIPMTNDKCVYNNKNIFVFKNVDESVSIGEMYVDMGYVGIGLGFLCLFVIVGIRCKKCINNLPCMN